MLNIQIFYKTSQNIKVITGQHLLFILMSTALGTWISIYYPLIQMSYCTIGWSQTDLLSAGLLRDSARNVNNYNLGIIMISQLTRLRMF